MILLDIILCVKLTEYIKPQSHFKVTVLWIVLPWNIGVTFHLAKQGQTLKLYILESTGRLAVRCYIFSLKPGEWFFPSVFNCSYYGDWALRRGEMMSLHELRPQGEEELDLIPGFVASVTELSFVKHLAEASSTIFKWYWSSVACKLHLQNETIYKFYSN